jgi:prevent-host-death family protein
MATRKQPQVRETVSLYEAKTTLSSLVERAAHGEEFVIAKSGKPKALLVPIRCAAPVRGAGNGWCVRTSTRRSLRECSTRSRDVVREAVARHPGPHLVG